MEPLGNGELPGYDNSQRMKRSSSETPDQSNEILGSIKSADLAHPDVKLKLLWEKDGVFRTLPGGRKTFGSTSTKRRMNAVSTDKNIALGIPEVRHPSDVVFLSNNDIVVADMADRNLQVMSSDPENVEQSKGSEATFRQRASSLLGTDRTCLCSTGTKYSRRVSHLSARAIIIG